MADADTFKVRAIRNSDRFRAISSGGGTAVPLKTFLTEHALYYEEFRLARTYGVYDVNKADEPIVGYVTLVCSEIDLGDHATLHPSERPETTKNYPYTTYPALKIARLLIDSKYRRRDLGTSLIYYAFGVAVDQICPRVGCRFLVVDSKKDATAFYEKLGFVLLETTRNKKLESPIMFVDLKAVSDTIPSTPRRTSAGGAYQQK